MKKKILLFVALLSLLACIFAIGISAETPSNYIEFGARFPGSDEYITVYTEDAEVSSGNPRINFATYKFYSDVDFTVEVDITTVTGLDFSVSKVYGSKLGYVNRITNPSSPFVNCTEVKWFTHEKAMGNSIQGVLFKGWTSLESFDFGSAKTLGDNTFEGCGFKTLVIPATVTQTYSRTFAANLSLTSVVFEGSTKLAGNANAFYGCSSLESVDLGTVSYIGKGTFGECTSLKSVVIPNGVTEICSGTFSGCTALESVVIPNGVTVIGESAFKSCTALTSIDIPSSVTEIQGSAFNSCSNLSSITMREGITKIGNYAFYKIGGASLHIPASVQSLGYQVAEDSGIVSLTFAKNSSLTFIDHRAFRNCDSLVGPVIFPDGLIEIDYGTFNNCDKLKAVKIPNSVTTFSASESAFSGCKALEYVQFSNQITSICKAMFEGCTSLKAISLPDSIETIGYKALRGCTSLQAVYLPSSLTSLGNVNAGSSDWGVFYQSTNVYLVNEPFEVFDGDNLVENFVMPQKPEVYYMPSGLTTVGNSEFQNCTNLNNYIVFPVGVTRIAECGQGAFYGIGSGRASNPVTLVFLGDMTDLRIRQHQQEPAYSNIHYVFANPNDVDLNSLTLIIGSANNKKATNTYMYFCAGKVSYDLTTFAAPNATVYTVQETDYTKTTYTAQNQPHFADPRKSVWSAPTCVDNKKQTTYCFCGAESGVFEVEDTFLGHEHSVFLDLIYADFSQQGYYSYKCERCEDVNNDKAEKALFKNLGYATQEYGKGGISVSFLVNYDAVDNYNTVKGTSIEYGVFAVAEKYAEGKEIINADGTTQTGVASVDFSKRSYDVFAIRVNGFETDEHKNASIALGCYVIANGKVTYLQVGTPNEGAKYCYTSYNEQIG